MTNKYEFVPGDEITIAPGRTVKRIRALVAIATFGVAAGDVGGYVENVENLSQVSGNAWVSGNARVYGDAWVYGDARVSGNARVSGDARVYGNAAICFFGGFGSAYRQTTAFIDSKIKIRITCGCFTGSLSDFRASVIKTHGEESKHGKTYLGIANLIEFHFAEAA